MSRQNDRDQFIAEATQAGLHVSQARSLLRYAATLQRLAEAQCNGDWPADNGQRPTAERTPPISICPSFDDTTSVTSASGRA